MSTPTAQRVPPVLSLREVSKRFVSPRSLLRPWRRPAERWALRGISLEVGPGEVVGILGPNGAGKSTVLRCAAGLVSPTSGSVSVLGEPPTAGNGRVRSRIGWVAREDRSFNQRLTGRENLAFFARLSGLSGAELRERCSEVLGRTGLLSRADEPFRGWSAGMRQRLVIARALLGRPSLLLLDEPSTGLDPARRQLLHEVVARLASEERVAVLMASHDLDEVERLSDVVLVFAEGEVVARGSYREVESAAAALFDAERQREGL